MANGPTTTLVMSFESKDLKSTPSNLISFEPFSLGKTAVQRLDETKGNYVKRTAKSTELSNNKIVTQEAINSSQTAVNSASELVSGHDRTLDTQDVNSKPNSTSVNSVPNHLPVKNELALSINNNNSSLKDLNKLSPQTTKLLNALLNTSEHNRPLTSIILSNNLSKKFNSSTASSPNQFSIKSSIAPQNKRKVSDRTIATVHNRERKVPTDDSEQHMMNLETQLKLLICIDHEDSHLTTFSSSSTSEGPSSNCSRPSSICSSPISPSMMKSSKSSAAQHCKSSAPKTTAATADVVRASPKKANKSILSSSMMQTVNSKLPTLACLSKTSKALLSSKFTSKVCSKVNSKLNPSKSSSAKTLSSVAKLSPTSWSMTNVPKGIQPSQTSKSDNDTNARYACIPTTQATARCGDDSVIIQNQLNSVNGALNSLASNIDRACTAIDSSHRKHHARPPPPPLIQTVCRIENQIKHHHQDEDGNKQTVQQLSNLPSARSPVERSSEIRSDLNDPIVMSSTANQLNSKTSEQTDCPNDLQKAISSDDATAESELRNESSAVKLMQIERPVDAVAGETESMMLQSDFKQKTASTAKDAHHELRGESTTQQPYQRSAMTSLEPVSARNAEPTIIRNLNKSLSLATNLNNLSKVNGDFSRAHCARHHHRTQAALGQRRAICESTGQIECSQASGDNLALTSEMMKITHLNVSNDLNGDQATHFASDLRDSNKAITQASVSRSKSDIGHRVNRNTIASRFRPDCINLDRPDFNGIDAGELANPRTSMHQQQSNDSAIGGSFTDTLNHAHQFSQSFHHRTDHYAHYSPNSFSSRTRFTPPYHQATAVYANETTNANRLFTETNQAAYHYSSQSAQQQYNCNQSTVDSYYTLDSSSGAKLVLPEMSHQTDYRPLDRQRRTSDQRIENRIDMLPAVDSGRVASVRESLRIVDSLLDSVLDRTDRKLDQHKADSWLEAISRNQSSKGDHHHIAYLKSELNDRLPEPAKLADLTKSFNCIQLNGDFKSQTNLIANLDPTLANSFNSVSLPTNKPNLNNFASNNTGKPTKPTASLKKSLMTNQIPPNKPQLPLRL